MTLTSSIIYIPTTYENALDYLHTYYHTITVPCNFFIIFDGSIFFSIYSSLPILAKPRVQQQANNITALSSKTYIQSVLPHISSHLIPSIIIHHLPFRILSLFQSYGKSVVVLPSPSTSSSSSILTSPIIPNLYFLWFPGTLYQHPDYLFSYYLNRLNNKYVLIERENAYISSLGGGAYLCRDIPLAIRAAYTQIYLSFLINDIILFTRSIVHLIYIAIAAGQWKTAKHIIKVLYKYSIQHNDYSLLNILKTAYHYLKNTQNWYKIGILNLSPLHIMETITKPAIISTITNDSSTQEIPILNASTTKSESNSQTNHTSLSSSLTTNIEGIPEEQYRKDPHFDDIYRQRITRYHGRII